ncbi:MAG TPA: NIPSNAP family protein [Candidatus Eisenbacteria bacterium]|nr:NIPSNAP family protein [Candidatus Eisenbacteria bacterium]
MLYELRSYRVRPGRRDEWVDLMEQVIIPFQAEKGMVIVASFVAEEDPDLYVWIRRFESEDEREQQYAEVYQSDRWKSEIAPRVDELLDRDRMVVTRLVPTRKSVLR